MMNGLMIALIPLDRCEELELPRNPSLPEPYSARIMVAAYIDMAAKSPAAIGKEPSKYGELAVFLDAAGARKAAAQLMRFADELEFGKATPV